MSIDNATPDEWDRAMSVVEGWKKKFPPDRGLDLAGKQAPDFKRGGVENSGMSIDIFCRGAGRTAKRVDFTFDLLHAALGLTSEAGEFADAVKKNVVYGKPLDKENLIEELGDLLWFTSLACDVLNVDMADVMRSNLEKLQKRYPEKYTDFHAQKRFDKR